MDAQTLIFLLSGIMFVGAFGFGYVPLSLELSSKRLIQFTAVGAGVLIASAFLVIIPEGMEIMEEHEVEPSILGMAILGGFALMLVLEIFGLPHAVHHDEDKDLLGLSATFGLLVHGAADGLAVGASVSSSTETGLIVFVAIMLHKGPAAFGLSSFLQHIKIDKQRSRMYLLLFAISSPIMAIATFFILKDTTLATDENIGLALMFSAGTFIYVATVDVLPEVHSHEHGHDSSVKYVILGMALIFLTTLISHH